jgi:hypothetical protein
MFARKRAGFLWLGLATVIWPVLGGLVKWGEGKWIRYQIGENNPLIPIPDLRAYSELFVNLTGAVLLFVAVFYLSKSVER